MINLTVIIIMLTVAFICGAIVGAGFYYLLKFKFIEHVENLLNSQMAEFKKITWGSLEEMEQEFKSHREHISDSTQETIDSFQGFQEGFKLIENSLFKFQKELENAHNIRQFQENEIIKLKNIIKRQNKQKER